MAEVSELRLLGSGSKDGGCPALYACPGGWVVQGITARDGQAVLVPHGLLDWCEPGTTLTVQTTTTPGTLLIAGTPVEAALRDRLTLAEDETAVVVAR